MNPSRWIIGLMSGTSADAIDAALVRIDGRPGRYHAVVFQHVERTWPRELRQRLLAVMAPAVADVAEICELNFLVAREFAAAAEACIAAAGIAKEQVEAIGSHGQTICHLPPLTSKPENRTSKMPSTLQLGDPSVIATLTGITTAGNFRPADMAVGGQGAPLVPWTDDVLLSHPGKTRCVQNIGGIANVTYMPPRGTNPKTENRNPESGARTVIAFDTGPGNMVIDAVVSLTTGGRQRFDRGGRMAARGTLDMRLFRELQRHPYFERRPPKSTGREEFGAVFAQRLLGSIENQELKIESIAHTLTRLTAWSIADAYLQFLPRLPDEVIVCGGGAENPVLMKMLGEELGGLRSDVGNTKSPTIRRIDEFGVPNKAKEAASFALLAAATLDGVPANLPSVTGAQRPVVLGVVARPRGGGG